MGLIEESIEIEALVGLVYEQWSRFEELPCGMDAIVAIEQLDEKRLRWVAEVGRQRYEWDATITEQVPDERIAWREDDDRGSGAITFTPIGEAKSRLTIRIEWEPKGPLGKLGEAFTGIGQRQTRTELENFKRLSRVCRRSPSTAGLVLLRMTRRSLRRPPGRASRSRPCGSGCAAGGSRTSAFRTSPLSRRARRPGG